MRQASRCGPLRQITGDPEFNEIFFSDVQVPRENLLGEIGGGWQVAMTTLLHERGTLGFALAGALDSQVRKLSRSRRSAEPTIRSSATGSPRSGSSCRRSS